MLIFTEEKPYGKSIHAGEEPYINDFIIVSFVKKPVHKNNPLSNLLVKIYYFVHRELLAANLLLTQRLNHYCSFCAVKLILIFVKEQYLNFSWLCIQAMQFRFWASHIYVEHCSIYH